MDINGIAIAIMNLSTALSNDVCMITEDDIIEVMEKRLISEEEAGEIRAYLNGEED